MKKILLALIATLAVFFIPILVVGTYQNRHSAEFKVAMVTDFSDVNDGSFNQACYEGAKEWSRLHNVTFNYYKPASLSKAERIKSMTLAIDRGYKVILCPGFALGDAIEVLAPKHPDVQFVGLDIGGEFPYENVTIYNYYEEISGYMAGYAVVKEGHRNLGFLGGQDFESVIKYGYGFIQGADKAAQELAAAHELESNIDIQYVYAGQFYGSSEVYNYIDQWYKNKGTKVVFSCGGSIYTSVALAARENGGYMVGVDGDQAPIVDRDFGPGICITSATKEIKKTVINTLEKCYQGEPLEGKTVKLGLISSEHPEENFVQLPLATWRMNNFTIDDYKVLVKYLIDNPGAVSPSISPAPVVSEYTKVTYHGFIK